MQTYEEVHKGLFGIRKILVPITNDVVFRGRCLECHPLNSAGGRRVQNDNSLMDSIADINQYDAPPPTAPTKNDINIMVPDYSRGHCPNCGMQTHEVEKQGFFGGTKLLPITNEYVIDGKCLLCHPFDSEAVPTAQALPAFQVLTPVPLENSSEHPYQENGSASSGRRPVCNPLKPTGAGDTKVQDDSSSVEDADDIVPDSTLAHGNANLSKVAQTKPTRNSSHEFANVKVPSNHTSSIEATHDILRNNDDDNNITDPDSTPAHNTSSQVVQTQATRKCPSVRAKKKLYLGLLLVLGFLVAGGIALYFWSKHQPKNIFEDEPTRPQEEVEPIKEDIEVNAASTPKPTMARENSVSQDLEANVLLRGAKFSELPDTDSRKLALEWLLHDDPMQLDASDSALYQRFILALLAFESLGPDDWLSDGDECEWSGVSCNDGSKVSELDLSKFQLRLNLSLCNSLL
jgi:hypothetical protein